MAIILRTVKGSELTFAEVDGNFQSLFYSSSFDGTNLVLYTTGSTSQSIDLSTLSTDTGSLMVTGSILNGTLTFTKGDDSTFDLVYNTGSFSGSFEGDGSGLTGLVSSSYSQTASYIENAQTASYVENAQTASYIDATNIDGIVASSSYSLTSSYVENAQTSSYISGADVDGAVNLADTASFVTTAQTASYVTTAQTASYVETSQTASYVLGLNVNGPVADAVNAVSSSYASTASYVENAQTASYVENAQTASYVETAQTASYVDAANIDGIITSASYALTASHAQSGDGTFSGSFSGSFEGDGSGLTNVPSTIFKVTGSANNNIHDIIGNQSISESHFGFIAGGITGSIVGTTGSVILGGSNNSISSSSTFHYQSIIGGNSHSIWKSSRAAIIGGYKSTITDSSDSFMAGGTSNEIGDHTGVVSIIGGRYHLITGSGGTTANYSGIFQGDENTILSGSRVTILGGLDNLIEGSNGSSIIGGAWNEIKNGGSSIILGGSRGDNFASRTAIIGGDRNVITNGANDSAIMASSASLIEAAALRSAVIGGFQLTASAADTVYVPNLVVTGSITGDGSGLTGIASSSYALTASYVDLVAGPNVTINQVGTSFEISGSVSAVDTGSLLTTASAEFAEITFTKGDGSTFLVDSTPRQVIETVKNLESGTLVKGTPVYASGSTGNAVHVYAASASLSSRMPAAYILNQDLTSGQEGEGLLLGFINGVDTSAFASGDVVYVAADGGYTNVKPTGSNLIQNLGKVIISDAVNGSGVISGAGRSNDVPNITEGYVWIGNSDGVATPTATSSIQSVVSSSYASTSSYVENTPPAFPYEGDAVITGSLTISGSFNAFRVDSDDIVLGKNAGASLEAGTSRAVLIGENAGDSLTTSLYVVGIGYNAVSTGTDGITGTVAIGYRAGQNGTTGDYNTLLGYNAGQTISTGGNNIALGRDAMSSGTVTGNYNTSLGPSAGKNLTSGHSNVFGGYLAGNNNTTGARNIYLGTSAGDAGVSGNYNIAIGDNANVSSSGENQIAIGRGVTTVSDGDIRIGSGSIIPFSGSSVTGDVVFPSTASAAYFVGDGSGLTGVGGVELWTSQSGYIQYDTSGSNNPYAVVKKTNGTDETRLYGDGEVYLIKDSTQMAIQAGPSGYGRIEMLTAAADLRLYTAASGVDHIVIGGSTGNTGFNTTTTTGGKVTIKGDGNSASTTNLLLQSNNLTTLLEVKDDGAAFIDGKLTIGSTNSYSKLYIIDNFDNSELFNYTGSGYLTASTSSTDIIKLGNSSTTTNASSTIAAFDSSGEALGRLGFAREASNGRGQFFLNMHNENGWSKSILVDKTGSVELFNGLTLTGSIEMAYPSASGHQSHQVPGIYKTPGFSYLVDNDFYVDDNIRLHWDTSGNDFAVEILTNPSAGEVHIVYNNEGTYTYFDRQVSDGLLDIDTSFLDDEVGIATLCAPDDNSYPFYRVTLVRSNVTYTNRMYATIEKILN